MELYTISESKFDATQKWNAYKKAIKAGNCDVRYRDLAKIYYHLKLGRKMIDIHDAIKRAGVKKPGYPNFAIAKASSKNVWCRYYKDGSVQFRNAERWNPIKEDVDLKSCLPTFEINGQLSWQSHHTLKAPVPIIPPEVHPGKLNDTHYILWEVDEWEQVPPTDPYLLKRITDRIFIILKGWDLTPMEKAVMAAYL